MNALPMAVWAGQPRFTHCQAALAELNFPAEFDGHEEVLEIFNSEAELGLAYFEDLFYYDPNTAWLWCIHCGSSGAYFCRVSHVTRETSERIVRKTREFFYVLNIEATVHAPLFFMAALTVLDGGVDLVQ